MVRFRRRNKLPKRSLQLRLTMTFVCLSALALILQFLLFLSVLGRIAAELPNDGTILLEASHWVLTDVLFATALVVLPLTFLVGVLTTFKIAGPIYRFELYLQSLARGERPGPCKLRSGDQLQEFCDLLNKATQPLQRPVEEKEPEKGKARLPEPEAALPASSEPASAPR